MKKLLLLLLALSFTVFLQAQSPNSTLPPEAVIASFSKTFPNAKNAIWEKHGKKYDVYFIADSVDHTATYKDTGAQILHRFPVALTLLPKEVIAGIEHHTARKTE
ncbi:MAG: hypothetical protein H7Y07_06015 [Pyrinomonadaceae bacterium]|nr:hypothetical protein [Sphingobacteriaceae bacterium]